MDQPAHCGSLQRARRHGASVAQRVRARGVEALKATVRSLATGKTEAALRVVTPLLELRRRPPLDDPPPYAEIEAREASGSQIAIVQALRKLPLARRAHAQAAKAPARSSAWDCAFSCAAQAVAGDIILLYGDESEP